MLRFDLRQVRDDVIIRLVPCRFLERAIGLTDERRAQAVLVIVELEGIASLQASVRVIHLGIDRRLDAQHFIALGRDGEVATDAAIRANGARVLCRFDGLREELVADGRGRASLRTSSTLNAGRIIERSVQSFDDARIKPTTVHGQHELPLHFIASTHAA